MAAKARSDLEAAELARAHIYEAGGLATIAELGRRWGVSRSRAHEMAQREDFPAPVATVSEGAVALYAVVEADEWRNHPRPPGRRPKKEDNDDGTNPTPMTRYVVVTREQRLPVERFFVIEAAAKHIRYAEKYGEWTVLAQEGNKITASTPYRELTMHEKRLLERALYPSLFE